jgi:GNAT superfamily N-acetyltransferase
MEWKKESYKISDDQAELDMDFVIASLHTTYWAEDRPDEIISRSFAASTVLSLFKGERQVGFARLVGDGCTFCWVCDVFIDPDLRGRGLGKFLLGCVCEHPLTQVKLKLLITKDAQGLYEQYGFRRCEAMSLRELSY